MTTPQEPTQKNRRQAETDKRRAFLLETAITAFMEKGYHQTGIRDIAKRAGVSLGNLYNHFPGKEAVLLEIARLEAEELTKFSNILEGTGTPAARLKTFVGEYLAYCCRPENVLLTIEITSEATRNPSVGEIYSENRRSFLTEVTACLNAAAEQQEISPLPQPDRVAHYILSLTEAEGQRICFEERKFNQQDAALLWAMIFQGLNGDTSSTT